MASNTNTNDGSRPTITTGAPSSHLTSTSNIASTTTSSSLKSAVEAEIETSQHRSSTWLRQQALFGVALRSAGARAKPDPAAAAVVIPPPILYEAPHSVRSQAVAVFAAVNKINLQRKEINPMVTRGGEGSNSGSGSGSTNTVLTSLPRLDDNGSIVQGWITIIKYLSWKHLPANSNTFYPMVTAASFTSNSNTSTTATATPSAFAIDSFLDSFASFQPTLDFLTQAFILSITRGGGRPGSSLPYLQHTFDKDGGLLVPQWQQPHSTPTHTTPAKPKPPLAHAASHGPATFHSATHPSTHPPASANHPTKSPVAVASPSASHHIDTISHAQQESESTQFTMERQLRLLRSFLNELQTKLTAQNPNLTLEQAIQYLRGEHRATPTATPEPTPTSSPTLTPASSSTTTPSTTIDIEFQYLLGTRAPTLADYVVYFWLHQLSMLRAFMPILSPLTHTTLFVFAEKMTRFCAPHVFEITGLQSGMHLLLARHSLLQAYVPPQPLKEEDELTNSTGSSPSDSFSISVTPASSSTAIPTKSSPSPPPTTSTGISLPPPTRSVPRLTNVNDLVPSDAAHTSASNLAVEEVPDLMEYVDKIAVRARAATPATPAALENSETTTTKPTPVVIYHPSPTAPTEPATSTPVVTDKAKKELPATPLSSFALSRPLTQRLLDTIDSAAIHWKVISERTGVKLLIPCVEPSGEHPCYRSMAVTTFPLSPPVLLSFLWSMDCYKVLDPLLVMDSRELAPHASSTRAKYSYLSVEMKSSSAAAVAAPVAANTAPFPVLAPRRNTEPGAPAPSTSPAPPTAVAPPPTTTTPTPAASAITKVSSARFDFLLLNTWTKLLDGTYILLHQSVQEDEINAPRKWTKGCIRASLGGTSSLPDECGVSGWIMKPFYQDGLGPMCQVYYLSSTEFPARVGAWISGELEKRTLATMVALKSKLKTLMGTHPLIQLTGNLHAHERHQTLHLRLSQAVSPTLVNAVSGHGVQTLPHPKVKG